MQTFNIHRFGNTLLWQIADSKKTCLNFLAFCFLLSIVGELINFMSPLDFNMMSPLDITKWRSDNVAIFFYAIFLVYLLTFGTLIVSNISDKTRRINAFILPASKLEKFVSRYVFLFIVIPLVAIVGLFIGDLVQMIVLKIVTGDAYSITLCFLNRLGEMFDSEDTCTAFFLAWFIHSFLLLLGTCFRRHAWIKSALVAVTIAIAIGLVSIVGTKEILDLIYGKHNYNVVLIDSPWVTIIACLVFFALTVFNYWASFRIYARMQAINNKWHNF